MYLHGYNLIETFYPENNILRQRNEYLIIKNMLDTVNESSNIRQIFK